MRSIWNGHIAFGLVLVPVALYPAESSHKELELHLHDRRDGARIRYARINEATEKEVPWSEIVKGHDQDGKSVMLTPEDFQEAGKSIVKGGIEIVEFVDEGSISPLYFERPYYIEPGKKGERGYVLLREALRESGQIGIAKVAIRSRENLGALMVMGDMLVLVLMRFADEIRVPDGLQIPKQAKPPVTAKEVQLAERLLEGMRAKWKPEQFRDQYGEALLRVIEQKARGGGKRPARRAEDEPPASYNIMDLLQKSVGHKGSRAPAPARGRRRAAAPKTRAAARTKRRAG